MLLMVRPKSRSHGVVKETRAHLGLLIMQNEDLFWTRRYERRWDLGRLIEWQERLRADEPPVMTQVKESCFHGSGEDF